MSTVRSSAGEAVTRPDVPVVPTAVPLELDGEPPPSIEKKSTPVNMLNSATMMNPPMPSGIIVPPDRPRMSSILLRSPAVQRMAPPAPAQLHRTCHGAPVAKICSYAERLCPTSARRARVQRRIAAKDVAHTLTIDAADRRRDGHCGT